MSSIGPHDRSLASLINTPSNAATASSEASTATASRPSIMPGRPANITGSVAPPRSDLPPLVRENTVASVRSRAAGPMLPAVGSRQVVAQEKLSQASSKLKEASDNGVSLAKASFFKKCLNVGAALVGVVVAAMLTVASGGVAAPLMAMTCINLAVSCGDAYCAHRNLRNAQDLAQGKPVPPERLLPGGNSCIKNMVHAIAVKAGASPDTAKKIASAVSGFFQLGLAVGAAVAGQFAGALDLGLKISSIVANVVKALVAGDTAVTSGIAETAVGPDDAGHSRELVRQGTVLADQARAMGAEVDMRGQTPVEREIGAVLSGDADARQRAEKLVGDAVGQYGSAAVNTAVAISTCISIGRTVCSIL